MRQGRRCGRRWWCRPGGRPTRRAGPVEALDLAVLPGAVRLDEELPDCVGGAGGPSRGRPTPPGSPCGPTSTRPQSSRSTDSTECARRFSPCRPDGLPQATSTRCGPPMAPQFSSRWRGGSRRRVRAESVACGRPAIASVGQVLTEWSRDRLHLPGRARRRCGRWFPGSRAGRGWSAGFRGLAFAPRVVAYG